MLHIELTWQGEQRYRGVGGAGATLELAPSEAGGMSAPEALLVALAGCSAYDVVAIVRKRRATLTWLTVQVRGEQAPAPPWPFTTIHLTFHLHAAPLTQAQAERAVDIALNRYCPVRASLSPTIAVTFEVVLGVEG